MKTTKKPVGEKAASILVSVAAMKAGPPPPFRFWNQPGAMLAFLRQLGIDAEDFINYTRAKYGAGFILYYRGEEPTMRARVRAAAGMINGG